MSILYVGNVPICIFSTNIMDICYETVLNLLIYSLFVSFSYFTLTIQIFLAYKNQTHHIRYFLHHIAKTFLNFPECRQFLTIRLSLYIEQRKKGCVNMDWIQELTQKKSLCCSLTSFLDQHGFSGLEKALQLYSNAQAEYICKTKAAVTKIKIYDIYYLEIQTHTITIHTEHGDYQKYGSLTNELKFLAPYGFIRCRQNCLVSLEKIHSIYDDTITLTNHLQLHMSQRYAPKVLAVFARSRISR